MYIFCDIVPTARARERGEGFSFILDFEVLEHWTLNFFFIHCSWFKVFKETRRNVGRWDSIFNPLQICVMTNHLLEHSVLKITTWLCLVNSVGAVSSVHTLKGGWVTWLDSWHLTAASHLPRLGRSQPRHWAISSPASSHLTTPTLRSQNMRRGLQLLSCILLLLVAGTLLQLLYSPANGWGAYQLCPRSSYSVQIILL